ncbi:MAG: ribokinase, partial [Oscillochloris sp.]|nr:ribokinase [Oscillochloris sp.]
QAPIVVDPQGLLRGAKDGKIFHEKTEDFAKIAAMATVVKANELETQLLTGIDPRANPCEAVRSLRALGCEIAIVTLAEAGSYIDDGQQQLRIPAYSTEARDPTGAGDTYMAGFIHAYLQNPHDLYRAGCMGSALASIWIEHTGPEAPITPLEVMRRLATLV